MMGRRVGCAAVAALSVVLVAASCGGGGGDTATGDGEIAAAEEALATLEVISTDVTVQPDDAGQPAPAQSGDPLAEGDTVRTDPTGFAEISFFDGSLTRVDTAATFTLVDLQDTEAARVVATDLSTGRSWNRIEDLTESETWDQDTPVASATVRGTAYAADCTPTPTTCTFTVVEGVVELTLPDGSIVVLTAGQRLTLTAGQPPPTAANLPLDELRRDPWIARNLELDQQDGLDDRTGAGTVTGTLAISNDDLGCKRVTTLSETVAFEMLGNDPATGENFRSATSSGNPPSIVQYAEGGNDSTPIAFAGNTITVRGEEVSSQDALFVGDDCPADRYLRVRPADIVNHQPTITVEGTLVIGDEISACDTVETPAGRLYVDATADLVGVTDQTVDPPTWYRNRDGIPTPDQVIARSGDTVRITGPGGFTPLTDQGCAGELVGGITPTQLVVLANPSGPPPDWGTPTYGDEDPCAIDPARCEEPPVDGGGGGGGPAPSIGEVLS